MIIVLVIKEIITIATKIRDFTIENVFTVSFWFLFSEFYMWFK